MISAVLTNELKSQRPNDGDSDGDGDDDCIPDICHFWYATIIFRPVKGTPKKCVNSRQKFPRDKTA